MIVRQGGKIWIYAIVQLPVIILYFVAEFEENIVCSLGSIYMYSSIYSIFLVLRVVCRAV